MLKASSPIIPSSLCYIFNFSLYSCSFPNYWKIARVSPIFKEGNKDDCPNYRPISELPVISRILEIPIYNQIHDY